jgi:cytochrome P450
MTTQPSDSPAALRAPIVAPGHWLWGHGLALLRRPLETFTELSRLGPVVQMRLGRSTAYLVNDPDLIKQVFLDVRAYGKQTPPYVRVRSVIGMGLVTSEGELWRRQRRIAQPAFHKERIAGFARTMLRAAEAMADRWQTLAELRARFDVAEELAHVTLETVCETLLGSDAGDAGRVVESAFAELNRLITPYLHSFAPLPLWLPTPQNRRIRACIAALDGAVYGLIARRRGQAEETPDLLSMLLRARDADTGEGMNDTQLRDEVMTMLLAGHETTATSLSWAFYLLSQSPEAMDRLGAELDAVLAGRSPALADLERLPYARMVLDETLRLYPPLWATSRSVTADTTLGGYPLPAGAIVIAVAFTVHRSPSLWADPDAFRPERFEPKLADALHRYAYFPFLGGPRMCIGINFAQMQSHILLATLAQRYRWSLVPGHPIDLEPLVTLRPRHGVRVTITARDRSAAPGV